MKPLSLTFVLAMAVLIVGGAAAPLESPSFVAILSGAEEVPPRETLARGTATFLVAGDASEVGYRLTVANIENPFAAHVHCAGPEVNGPVGVTLFVGAAASGRTDGVLASGAFTGPDAGNACGWADLAAVLA
ncbi:MAG: CHRD domain-containing protein, partial [Anaerolineales bacterium]